MPPKTTWTSRCNNPTRELNHGHSLYLRAVTPWMLTLYPKMSLDAKVCDKCRKKLTRLYKLQKNKQAEDPLSIISEPQANQPSTSDDKLKDEPASEKVQQLSTSQQFHSDSLSEDFSQLTASQSRTTDSDTPVEMHDVEVYKSFSEPLKIIGQSPINRKKSQKKRYSTRKFKKIKSAVKKKILPNARDDEDDLFHHLKGKFKTLSRDKKVMLLTILPQEWSNKKIVSKFGASDYMVREAKRLAAQKGFLVSPDQRPGKSLPPETCAAVRDFYASDENSRIMPGKKDCISVKDNEGKKTTVQKRLVLSNLSELYHSFTERFPNLQIGFSKFCELRPKYCILAGPKGTHTVCVCKYHQNVILMLENSKISSLTDGQIKNYQDCLRLITCDEPNSDCFLHNCTKCPDLDVIQKLLEDVFYENFIETVSFRQWINVDRCNLEMLSKTSSEFVELLCDNLFALKTHSFIAKQQSSFLNECKATLSEGEVIVIGDFSENYSFVLQDEIQSYHWTSNQATVHPFVIYYKQDNELKFYNFVVISNCLEHNTTAVYLFQTKLIEFLKGKLNNSVKKIFYFSDGCSEQYKNRKNFSNLAHHFQDFGIIAEWHCFATSHGKGPCDGLGGTVKRMAARASLQRPLTDQIQTPQQLFDYAKENIPGMNFVYTTIEEHTEMAQILEGRFKKALPIPGTREYHAFITSKTSITKLLVKEFSSSSTATEVSVMPDEENLFTFNTNGYVISVLGDRWWLGYILDKNENEDEFYLSILHPSGPSRSYVYPPRGDRQWVSIENILCQVNPFTPTGRMYNLMSEDAEKAARAYHAFKASI